MLFFTKICMALHWMEQARSIALCAPPPIDIWAPRRIFDRRFSILVRPNNGEDGAFLFDPTFFNFGLRSPIVPNRKSKIETLKSFGVPVGMFQAALAAVL